MEKKLTWLAISLFYEKSGWHSLFQDALKPFLSSEEFGSNAMLYTLAFNRERGDNIRLNIWAPIAGANTTLTKCESRFLQYFHAHPIARPQESWIEGDHFFLPFPANSVQYGVYRTPKLIGNNIEEIHKFDMRLSSRLLEAFDEPVSTDSILIVAVLLSLSVIYAIAFITGIRSPVDESGYLQFRKIKGQRIYSEEVGSREVFAQIYEVNSSMLLMLKEEIFCRSAGGEYLPEWVERWKLDCIQNLGRRLSRDVPAYQTYFELSNLICQQLGYDEKFQNMVDFVVNATMKERTIREIV